MRESSQTSCGRYNKPPLGCLDSAARRKIRLPGQLRRQGPVAAQALTLAEADEVAPDQAGVPAEGLHLALALHGLAQPGGPGVVGHQGQVEVAAEALVE